MTYNYVNFGEDVDWLSVAIDDWNSGDSSLDEQTEDIDQPRPWTHLRQRNDVIVSWVIGYYSELFLMTYHRMTKKTSFMAGVDCVSKDPGEQPQRQWEPVPYSHREGNFLP